MFNNSTWLLLRRCSAQFVNPGGQVVEIRLHEIHFMRERREVSMSMRGDLWPAVYAEPDNLVSSITLCSFDTDVVLNNLLPGRVTQAQLTMPNGTKISGCCLIAVVNFRDMGYEELMEAEIEIRFIGETTRSA